MQAEYESEYATAKENNQTQTQLGCEKEVYSQLKRTVTPGLQAVSIQPGLIKVKVVMEIPALGAFC